MKRMFRLQKCKIVLRIKVNHPIKNLVSSVGIVSSMDVPIKTSWQKAVTLETGEYEAVFEENVVDFSVGQYKICAGLSQNLQVIQYFENLLVFDILNVINEIDDSVILY